MVKLETVERSGVLVRLWSSGNEYHFSFVIKGTLHKGSAPNRSGAIAFAHDRIKACQEKPATKSHK